MTRNRGLGDIVIFGPLLVILIISVFAIWGPDVFAGGADEAADDPTVAGLDAPAGDLTFTDVTDDYVPPTSSASRGEISVDRVWSAHDFGNALVSYTNSTRRTFQRQVTIQCDAYGTNNQKLGTNTRSFFAHEQGPIYPAFQGTVEVPVELHGARLSSMDCWIASAH